MKLKTVKKEGVPKLSLPGYYCIGAFLEDAGDDAEPLGIIIYSDTGKELIIEWLFVSPEYRGRGIGEKLLSGIYLLSGEKNYKEIGALLTETPSVSEALPVMEGYLKDRYFEREVPISGQWHGKLKAAAKSKALKEKKGKNPAGVTIGTASELTTQQKRGLLKMLSQKDRVAWMNPGKGEGEEKSIDDVSILCYKDKEILGAAIFASKGEDLFLTGFYAEGEDRVSFVLYEALSKAFEKYPEAVLHIALRDQTYEEKFTALLGPPEKSRMLMAETEMFFADQEYDAEVPDFLESLSESITS